MESRILVVGVGNEDRGDDGVGLVVARKLQNVLGSRIRVLEVKGDVNELLEMFDECRTAILVDAAKSGAAPGTIHRFEAAHSSIPTTAFRGCTHMFGVSKTLELARVLNRLPSHMTVYGIEGYDFEFGHTLSPEVQGAADQVVAKVVEDVRMLSAKQAGE